MKLNSAVELKVTLNLIIIGHVGMINGDFFAAYIVALLQSVAPVRTCRSGLRIQRVVRSTGEMVVRIDWIRQLLVAT